MTHPTTSKLNEVYSILGAYARRCGADVPADTDYVSDSERLDAIVARAQAIDSLPDTPPPSGCARDVTCPTVNPDVMGPLTETERVRHGISSHLASTKCAREEFRRTNLALVTGVVPTESEASPFVIARVRAIFKERARALGVRPYESLPVSRSTLTGARR